MKPSETDLLLQHLNGQRRHLLNTMVGLDGATLMQRILPSRWSPATLVNHLTHDVERFWFRQVVANEPNGFTLPEGMEEAWWISDDAVPLDILDAYRAEIAYTDEIVRARGLDDEPPCKVRRRDPEEHPAIRRRRIEPVVDFTGHREREGHVSPMSMVMVAR